MNFDLSTPTHPRTHEEGGVHAAALKHGLTLAADVTFFQLPVCADHTEDGSPVLEIQSWPILQPHLLVPLILKEVSLKEPKPPMW